MDHFLNSVLRVVTPSFSVCSPRTSLTVFSAEGSSRASIIVVIMMCKLHKGASDTPVVNGKTPDTPALIGETLNTPVVNGETLNTPVLIGETLNTPLVNGRH